MKKILFIFTLLILATIKINAQPQKGSYDDTEEKFAIKINPLSFFVLTSNTSLEYKVNKNLGAQIGFGYTGITISSLKYEGIRLTPELRFYTKGKALSGFYLAPYFRYQHYQLTDGLNKLLYVSYGGGLSFGFQKIFNSGFVLDIFVGPGYNSGKFSSIEGSKQEESLIFGLNGTTVRTGITLGFAF